MSSLIISEKVIKYFKMLPDAVLIVAFRLIYTKTVAQLVGASFVSRSSWVQSSAKSYERILKTLIAALLLDKKVDLGIRTGWPNISIM